MNLFDENICIIILIYFLFLDTPESQKKFIDVGSEIRELLDGCMEDFQLDDLMSLHYCDEGEDETGWRINQINKKAHPDEPKFKEFLTVECRQKSFKGTKIPQRRQVMAEAGLFYMGKKDHVQCFYCGGTLRDWKKGLDPFYEHAGWYPSCLFIKAVKGQEFVESCGKSTETFMPYMRQAYPV